MNNPVVVVIVVLLALMLFGALPLWPHAGFGYGYAPSGLLTILLIVLLLWALGVFGPRR